MQRKRHREAGSRKRMRELKFVFALRMSPKKNTLGRSGDSEGSRKALMGARMLVTSDLCIDMLVK